MFEELLIKNYAQHIHTLTHKHTHTHPHSQPTAAPRYRTKPGRRVWSLRAIANIHDDIMADQIIYQYRFLSCCPLHSIPIVALSCICKREMFLCVCADTWHCTATVTHTLTHICLGLGSFCDSLHSASTASSSHRPTTLSMLRNPFLSIAFQTVNIYIYIYRGWHQCAIVTVEPRNVRTCNVNITDITHSVHLTTQHPFLPPTNHPSLRVTHKSATSNIYTQCTPRLTHTHRSKCQQQQIVVKN